MIYFADLHVHSKYSRATSRQSDIRNLALWGALKGVSVLATGDFTHPAWRKEITENLEEDGTGLLRVRKEIKWFECPAVKDSRIEDVRFMLNVEISSIYKKDGVVRKIHNLIFMPDIESMNKFCRKLERLGNLESDGRPIMGLDCRNLLELALEASTDSFLVPAHIWTPWFSMLGSKSGFNSVEECFGDLSDNIFALETGLSSDPDMNRLLSSLDSYTLISNSDTHSPSRIGREVNVLTGVPGYFTIRDSLKKGGPGYNIAPSLDSPLSSVISRPGFDDRTDSFLGTIEFFPELGKYHWDGHRKCHARLDPSCSDSRKYPCPVCGKLPTVGVMNRVRELADRKAPRAVEKSGCFWKILPLADLIGLALKVGPNTKRVNQVYMDIVSRVGPEITVLWCYDLADLEKSVPPIVIQALKKVRAHEVILEPGFDGEYGNLKLLKDD